MLNNLSRSDLPSESHEVLLLVFMQGTSTAGRPRLDLVISLSESTQLICRQVHCHCRSRFPWLGLSCRNTTFYAVSRLSYVQLLRADLRPLIAIFGYSDL